MRDVGIDVNAPEKKCTDRNCPFHGTLKVRGQIIKGKVVGDRMQSTVTVERSYLHYLKKFERYEKRKTKLSVHNPACIGAKKNDKVKIMGCRPISKGKTFVVVEVG